MFEDPTIQQANAKALENGVQISYILQMVNSARKHGLAVPVLLVGYCSPVRAYAYGEEKLLRDCKAAGVDGLIIVDLPPEETAQFHDLCKSKGSAYPIFRAYISIRLIKIPGYRTFLSLALPPRTHT